MVDNASGRSLNSVADRAGMQMEEEQVKCLHSSQVYTANVVESESLKVIGELVYAATGGNDSWLVTVW